MKFCDKLILIGVLIIIIAILHYGLPFINKLLDGKEGMTASSRGGVLSDGFVTQDLYHIANIPIGCSHKHLVLTDCF